MNKCYEKKHGGRLAKLKLTLRGDAFRLKQLRYVPRFRFQYSLICHVVQADISNVARLCTIFCFGFPRFRSEKAISIDYSKFRAHDKKVFSEKADELLSKTKKPKNVSMVDEKGPT